MIILKKTGIFHENDSVRTDHEDYVYEQVESVIPYLQDVIKIEEDFTLRDFFDIVEKEIEVMQVVFGSHLGHFPLAPFIKEIQQDCLPDGKEEMDYIECVWGAEQFDYRLFYERNKDKKDSITTTFFKKGLDEPDEDTVNEISIYISVSGWGPFVQDPDDEYPYPIGEAPTHSSYGIEFTPLHRMAHLPIKLDEEFMMYERNELENDSPLIEGERSFTVFEIFGAILSELSFCGSPEDRNEKWRDVLDSVDEIKEQNKDDDDDDDDEEEQL